MQAAAEKDSSVLITQLNIAAKTKGSRVSSFE
jgi:hypothetical protein